MKVVIEPNILSGSLQLPPSKSYAHRALICGGLAENSSTIINCGHSEDVRATVDCLRALGADIKEENDRGNENIYITGRHKGNGILNCRESGSTLRFMLPVALAQGGEFIFNGAGRLMHRPLEDYFRIFDNQGIKYTQDKDNSRLYVNGQLKHGSFRLSGGVSSQYLTGLLIALPILKGDSEIILDTPLESSGYVDLTGEVQKLFGVTWEQKGNCYYIRGGQKYCATQLKCETDYSQAAFWIVAKVLGCDIKLEGLDGNTLQPDKVMMALTANMPQSLPKYIDVSQCPDIVPVLAVLCALTPGKRSIINGMRLRYKESDRLKAVSTLIKGLGGQIEERADGLDIIGSDNFDGGICDSFGDHRIAMSAAIAAIKAKENVTVLDAQSVNKSYPEFWEHYRLLGGKINEYEHR